MLSTLPASYFILPMWVVQGTDTRAYTYACMHMQTLMRAHAHRTHVLCTCPTTSALQVRGRAKPDGMCLVVGSCAEGVPAERNVHADLLYTLGDARDDMQVGCCCRTGARAQTSWRNLKSTPKKLEPENKLKTHNTNQCWC